VADRRYPPRQEAGRGDGARNTEPSSARIVEEQPSAIARNHRHPPLVVKTEARHSAFGPASPADCRNDHAVYYLRKSKRLQAQQRTCMVRAAQTRCHEDESWQLSATTELTVYQ